MAETVRTDAEIMTLWANNTTHQISAQDIRDGYVTLRGAAGPGVEETASFTLALTHLGQIVRCNHAATPITITIPTNATLAFPIGSILNFVQWGAASVFLTDGGGSPPTVSLLRPSTQTPQIRNQYGVVSLWKQDTNVWLLFGSLADV